MTETARVVARSASGRGSTWTIGAEAWVGDLVLSTEIQEAVAKIEGELDDGLLWDGAGVGTVTFDRDSKEVVDWAVVGAFTARDPEARRGREPAHLCNIQPEHKQGTEKSHQQLRSQPAKAEGDWYSPLPSRDGTKKLTPPVSRASRRSVVERQQHDIGSRNYGGHQ